jgi:hypothetical protein
MSPRSSSGVAAGDSKSVEMEVARVYVATSEVKEMIRREILRLEGTE